MIYSINGMASTQNVWLIGGGNTLNNSQEQIERNIIWLKNIFESNKDNNDYKIYFGVGNNQGEDVVFWPGLKSSTDRGIPLQRVFNKNARINLAYRRHNINDLSGTTKKSDLIKSLINDFSKIPDSKNILLVYNGHGGQVYNNEKENYLKLWGDSKLTVSELSKLLDRTPKSSTVRFVLTQCYSGAFYDLIFDSSSHEKLSPQIRCGFMAESEIREAEGCTLETNPDEFRDYTTYFFAALSKKSRNGGELLSNPDLNNNGTISFREAHLYTLRHAKSKDLSRSTSEIFLEKWAPWYLKWQTYGQSSKNIYWELAQNVAKSNNLTTNSNELTLSRKPLINSLKTNYNNIKSLAVSIMASQSIIKNELFKKWPDLPSNYEAIKQKLDKLKIIEIDFFVNKSTEYKKLALLSQQYQNALRRQLDLERNITQIDKVFRLKKLARLTNQFERFASTSEIQQYNSLVNCEETGTLF